MAKLKTPVPVPLAAAAVVVTGMASSYLADGYVSSPSKKAIAKLSKKVPQLVKADSFLADARKLGASMGNLGIPGFNRALGDITIRSAALLMENLAQFDNAAFTTLKRNI